MPRVNTKNHSTIEKETMRKLATKAIHKAYKEERKRKKRNTVREKERKRKRGKIDLTRVKEQMSGSFKTSSSFLSNKTPLKLTTYTQMYIYINIGKSNEKRWQLSSYAINNNQKYPKDAETCVTESYIQMNSIWATKRTRWMALTANLVDFLFSSSPSHCHPSRYLLRSHQKKWQSVRTHTHSLSNWSTSRE